MDYCCVLSFATDIYIMFQNYFTGRQEEWSTFPTTLLFHCLRVALTLSFPNALFAPA